MNYITRFILGAVYINIEGEKKNDNDNNNKKNNENNQNELTKVCNLGRWS